MLERTARCIESSSLRPLLPASQQNLKSRRTLHSAFWSHAAEDAGSSPLWAVLVRGADSMGALEAREQLQSGDNEATFWDFLYPAGTINFLRNFSGWGFDRQDTRSSRAGVVKLSQRLYTSSAKDLSFDQTNPPASRKGQSRSLLQEMGILRTDDYEEAWRQYALLDETGQNRIRSQLIQYYSTSTRVVDAERTVDLFEKMKTGHKDPKTCRRAIRAYLLLRNVQDAISVYNTCFKVLNKPVGAEELLAHFFDLSLWSRACDIWWDVEQYQLRNPTYIIDMHTRVAKLPNFESLLFELAEYVDKTVPDATWKVEEPLRSAKAAESETSALYISKDVQDATSQTIAAATSKWMSAVFSDATPTAMLEKTPCSSADHHRNLARFAAGMVKCEVVNKQAFNPSRLRTLLDYLLAWNCFSHTIFTKIYHLLKSKNELALLAECYLKVRQRAPTRMFGPVILHSVLQTFCRAHDTRGMKCVMDDFYRWYGKPSNEAYRQCMREFAAQGNAQAVHKLFDQFIKHHTSKEQPLKDPNWLSSILQVHSNRGEIDQVTKTFDSISAKYGLAPTILEWNILINAYGKVHNYEEAFARFERLLESPDILPDDYTIVTLMGICVRAGDLESVIALYQLAEDLEIKKTIPMIDCLVLAHIREDRLAQAERICQDATKIYQGNLTRMWNQLIVAYAERLDLQSANRILQRMSSLNIGYDEFTYGGLMQALAMARQPNEARKIMDEILPTAGYNPTAFHYAIVMGGYIAIRDWWNVHKLYSRLANRAMKTAFSITAMMLKGRVRKDEKLFERGSDEVLLQRSTEMFFEIAGSLDSISFSKHDPKKAFGRNPIDVAHPTSLYSYMMFVFANHNMIDSVQDLYERYLAALPERRKENHPPLSILSALAFMKWQERDLDGVEECWNLALTVAREQGRSLARLIPKSRYGESDGHSSPTKEVPKILYPRELDIARTLSWYLKSLATQGLTDKMIITIDNFLQDGFSLDMQNWNIYIRLLAQQDRPRLAFTTCEERLMPRWTGWSKVRRSLPVRNRLPLEIRAKKNDPRWIRPMSHTIIVLARSYLDIQAAAADSRAYRMMLNDLERLCPKTLFAIKTMQRSNDDLERDIMGQF